MIATPVLLGVSHTKQLMINTCTAFWMQRFCVLTISLNDSCILSWGLVALHIGVGYSPTPMCKTMHIPGKDITIITCYLGNITVEERYRQHS